MTASENNINAKRQKKLFWSLQSLEQFFSEQDSILGPAPDIWRLCYVSDQGNMEFPHDGLGSSSSPNSSSSPYDDFGPSTSLDIGIWSFAAHFGWGWSRVREHVSKCSKKQFTEPWRPDSMYAKILADMTDIENKMPWCHRWEPAKFHERLPDEISLKRDYWIPWIKLQFTWHTILTMLNHPFLYIMASRHHPNLAIPNTFWRKSSEVVLLHATWIVRMIDLVSEKQALLVDPFFAHAAAIAATVHLYYCCAADIRLKQKSMCDFSKCQAFLKGFGSFSKACEKLVCSALPETIAGGMNSNFLD